MACPEQSPTSSPTSAAAAASATSTLAVNDDCLELVFEYLDFDELLAVRQVQRRWDARTCATVTCLNGRVHNRIDTRPGGCSNGVQNRFPTAHHDALVRGLQACLPGPLTSIRFAAPRNHLSSDEGQRFDWAAFTSGSTRDDSARVSAELVAGLLSPPPPRGSAKESALTDIDVGTIRGGLGANMIAAGHPRLRRLGRVVLDDSSETGSLHFLGRMRPLTHVDVKTGFSCPTAVADQFVTVLARHVTHLRLHLGGGNCDTLARCRVLESLDLNGICVNLWAKLPCGPTLRRLRVVDSCGMLGDIVDFVKRRCPVLESVVLDEPSDRQLEDLSRELDISLPSDPAADSCAGLLRSPGSLPASLTELAVDTRLLLPSAQQVHEFRQSESSEARHIADFGSTIDGLAFPPALQRLALASVIATDRVSISFALDSSIRALDVIVLGQAAIRGGVFEAACSRLRLLSELRIDFDAVIVESLAPLLELRDVLTVLEIRGGTCADAAALWADRVRAHVDAFPKASRFAGGDDPRLAARVLDAEGASPDGRSLAQPGFTDVLSALRFLKVLQVVGCGLFHSVGFLDSGMASCLEQLEFRRNGATGPRVSPAGDVLRAVFGASCGPLQLRVLDVSGCVGRSHLASVISATAVADTAANAPSSAPAPPRVVFPPSRFPYLHTIAGIGAVEGYVRTNPGEAHPLTRRSYYRPSA